MKYSINGFLEINCADAEKLGVCDGDMLKVSSPRYCEVKPRLQQKSFGHGLHAIQYRILPINKLTNPARCPIAKIEYRSAR